MKKILFYTTLITQIVLILVVSYAGSVFTVAAQASDSSCPPGQVQVTDGNGNPKYDSDGHQICKSVDVLGSLG